MAGILDNSGGIWSFRQKVALFEQAIDLEKRQLQTLSDEVEYQISTATTRLNRAAADTTRDDSERRSAQRLLDDLDRSLMGYRSARDEIFRLIGADPTADNSQSAQAFLARLGQTLDEYYGLDGSSSAPTTVNEYVEVGSASTPGTLPPLQDVAASDEPKTLTPDRDAWFKKGVSAIEDQVFWFKKDLRDEGYAESEVQAKGNALYVRLMQEFGRDFNHWGESI